MAFGLGISGILGILRILSRRQMVCHVPFADNKTERFYSQNLPKLLKISQKLSWAASAFSLGTAHASAVKNLIMSILAKRALHFAAGKSFTLRSNASRRMQSVASRWLALRQPTSPAGMCGDFEFCKERYEGVYCVLDRMSDASKAQNIPQHKAKPIVKFIVPSPRIAINYPPIKKKQKKTQVSANDWSVRKISGAVLLSHSQIYSTIAAGALNYRVREGNVCFCSAIDTGNILQ